MTLTGVHHNYARADDDDLASGIFLPAQRPAHPGREPARLIIAAWGDQYIDDLLSLTIPALLAQGNLPAFADTFDCDLTLVVETRLFRAIIASPVTTALRQYCGLRLFPIDDILAGPYGVVLTFALMRGFEDLGEAATQTHLLFLNADFIVADGSYRNLAAIIKRGERLIVSPSYCVVHEEVAEKLLQYRDDAKHALTIGPRKLAATVIEHRHNTVRAKTVNQKLFRIHRYDQFYWSVDDNTLLGRQLPIAIIYMRPERFVRNMPTFWDYGAVSEYCPTTKPFVCGDSDEFLMAELRGRATFKSLLNLGWPTIEEIGADWTTFIVKDHLDYGRYPLVVHSRDVPPEAVDAEKSLNAFVESVYRATPQEVSNRDHPFWRAAYPHFCAENRNNAARIATARSTINAIHDELRTPVGAIPPVANANAPSPLSAAQFSTIGRGYHALFGSLPEAKAWHPYHASLMAPLAILRRDRTVASRILFVRSESGLSFLFFDRHNPATMEITPVTALKGVRAGLGDAAANFDLCFCQLSFDDLLHAAQIVEAVRPRMKRGAKIVLFFFNEELRPLDQLTYLFAAGAFPLSGNSTIALSGSRPSAIAMRIFRWIAARYRSLPLGHLLFAACLAIGSVMGRWASAIEEQRDPRQSRSPCLSMTIEITL